MAETKSFPFSGNALSIVLDNWNQKLDENDVLAVSRGGNMTVGDADTAKLSIEGNAQVSIVPVFRTNRAAREAELKKFGLSDFFDDVAAADLGLLLLEAGGTAKANGEARWNNVLSPQVTLKAGADVAFRYARPFEAEKPAITVVEDLIRNVRLPAQLSRPLSPGETVMLDYGGYLDLGASVSVGYDVAGATSIELADLAFTERYRIGASAKVGVSAQVAGRFAITVRGTKDDFARVTVRKNRDAEWSIAADVTARAKIEPENFPTSADDLLGSLLGTDVRHWLTLAQEVRKYSDFTELQMNLDTLAKTFIERVTGRAFRELSERTNFDELVAKVNRIAEEYANLENSAISLFDRYFDAATGRPRQVLLATLESLQQALTDATIGSLGLDSDFVEILGILTDGDPANFIKDRADELRQRIEKAIALAKDDAHAEIREFISRAKSQFALNTLLTNLRNVSPASLRQQADTRLIGFAQRLIGQTLEQISESEFGKRITQLNDLLGRFETMKKSLRDKIEQALNQTATFTLNARYNRATEATSLLEFDVNLGTAEGRQLVRRVGNGAFGDVLRTRNPQLVRNLSGTFTDVLTRTSTLKVTIVGARRNWFFSGLTRVSTASEQQIHSDEGGLVVTTNLTLSVNNERDRNGEKLFQNLLLRFVGESNGAVEFDDAAGRAVIDRITSMAADYQLGFLDKNTSEADLKALLRFADDFGLAANDQDAFNKLAPTLPRTANGEFGSTTATYTVRFAPEGLKSLFDNPLDDAAIRNALRANVIVNALAARLETPRIEVAWAYWSGAAFAQWRELRDRDINRFVTLQLDVRPVRAFGTPNLAPAFVQLNSPRQMRLLDARYQIEELLVSGFLELQKIVHRGERLLPAAYAQKLDAFGRALALYDKTDFGDNTFFAVLDALIRLSGAPDTLRTASLKLEATVDQKTASRMLLPVA